MDENHYTNERERGLKELAAGNYTEALECLGKAVHLRPDLCEAHFDMGRAFKSMGKIEAARQAFLRAQMIDAKYPNIESALNALPPPPHGRQEFEVGKEVRGEGGRPYKVLDIKKGGFGAVYIAESQSGTYIALKTFQAKYLWSDTDRERFEREAITWALLDEHPNVVTLLLIDRIEGFPCLGLEYVSGGDLSHLLAGGPLAPQRALDLALQFCDGMTYVHKKLGIVHRDIKPSNCLLSKEGLLKVTDFGLARSFGLAREEAMGLAELRPEIRAQYTTAMGTLAYMAPEQFDPAAQLDTRTDVYAFGIMFYQMLTGDLPLRGFLARKHILAKVESRRAIPESLLRLILRCVEVVPERRPSNFEEVREALELSYRALTGKAAPPRRSSTPALDAGRLSDKGSALAMLGRHEDALSFYDRALERDSQDSRLWNNKGAGLAALGRFEEAVACYDRGLALDPKHVGMWGNKATTLGRLGRYEEALPCLDLGLELEPGNSRLWGIKGICLNALQQHEKALHCFDRSLEITPRDQLMWNNKGLALVGLQRYDEALTCYERGLEIAPRDSELWMNKGQVLLLMGRLNEAAACFTRKGEIDPSVRKQDGEFDPSGSGVQIFDGRKIHLEALAGYDRDLEKNPSDIEVLLQKGGTLRVLERFQESLACCDQALTLAPKDTRLWNEKGLTLTDMGRVADGLACFDRGLQINERNSDLWKNKGLALSGLGKNQEAVACFNKGLEINPGDTALWSNKGDALAALGLHKEAIACQDHLKGMLGFADDSWQEKATALCELGKYQEALACCERGLALNPDDILLWINKGTALSELGLHQEALACWDRCLGINPGGPDFWEHKAFSLRNLGHYKEAIACCDHGLKISRRNSGLWLNKGLALSKLGNIQEAIICFDSGIKISPRDVDLWKSKGIALKKLGLITEAQACEHKLKELGG